MAVSTAEVNPGTNINNSVTYSELVELFTDAGATCSKAKKKVECNVRYSTDNEFSVTDVWSLAGFQKVGNQYSGPHPVHGSTTGHNLVIDTAKDCWKCFRHQTGGGPYEALAVDIGLIDLQRSHQRLFKGQEVREDG